ncbi:DUF4157 domain-containing protein [Rugamonas sp. CCM 8940]|uniref:eCIS core domain-containing protein n=1 Tax=Rugamonas sp. CCM 8940 TaxID=2765359 RepID=UPI0018F46162|nr:DUF4157 domain-containing protein [Rugamonas sp. CCM 8940]MBJ7311999.1 DUF4157 domain-containing protein [Rugamonas sp. CCM 8940]
MKTSAEKSTTTTTPATAHRAAQQPFFQKAALEERATPRGGGMVQAKLSVNQAGDHFEREADRMADHVMSAPTIVKPEWATGRASDWASTAGDRLQKKEAERPQRKEAEPVRRKEIEPAQRKEPERVQRKEIGAVPKVDGATESALMNKMSGGEALSAETRGFMEPRFGADFSGVRVHRDKESAGLSNRLSARAFTLRNHVFFSDNQFQPGTREGKHLLAHELTHTIQQGQSVQRSPQPAQRGAEPEIQRSPQVSANSATPAVQRLGIQDALDYFADKAYNIPGYRLLTIVLGFNPINQRSADRSAANILRALVELIPGGALIAQALENHGVFTRAGTWVEQQLATLGDIGGAIVAGLARFIDSLGWRDIFDLGGVWDRAKAIFTNPIGRLIDFGAGVVSGLMTIVREVVLLPLAALAEGTAGYDLLKALLGQDPITGKPVPRSPEILIGGFMKLIGQEEVWQNIQKGNAIGRAWDWFQGALEGLLGFARAIPAQIIATLRSITWQDVLTITGLFSKVGRAFLNIAGQFFSWAGGQVITLLEIIFSVVAPRAVPYVKKAQGAFRSIIQNPIGFVGNLVSAGKLGFQNFAANIGEHLKTALIKWITGPLGEAGVYIPQSFTLIEIVKLVLSVLGLTWANIRSKLVKIIPDPVLTVMEKTASVLVTLVRDGPAAAWQEIKNELNELKDSMIAKVTEMVTTEIVKAAVTKLVTMLNPAGAVIQAIIAIYNTITFFIQKINQIAAVVASFIDSIAAIASGQIGGAAKSVEQTLANTLVIVIAFLAKFAGLGGIPDKLVGVVKKIRAPIDKGLDKIVAWLGVLLKKIGAAAKSGLRKLLNWWSKKVPVKGGGESHTLTFAGEGKAAKLVLRSDPALPSVFLTGTAEKRRLAAAKSAKPIGTAQTHEAAITPIQQELRDLDDAGPDSTTADTASGKAATKADKLAKQLDGKLATLAGHISATLEDWQVSDPEVKKDDIAITRGSFSFQQKVRIGAQHADQGELVYDSKKKAWSKLGTRDGARLGRRHVISAHDMSSHYNTALVGKKVSEAKVLLEQRGSVGEALTPVPDLKLASLQGSAKTRYNKFFGYARNLFIGDQLENSMLQAKIDPFHPEMAGSDKKLDEHVRHIKRGWALDGGLKVTGLDEG